MWTAFLHLKRTVASVLLVIGAAALIGWMIAKLYVGLVTAD